MGRELAAQLLTISAGDLRCIRTAGAHLRTPPPTGKKGTRDRCTVVALMRVSLSAITRSPGLQRGKEVGGLTKSSEGVSIASALDTAAAVVILAVALSREALLGPKSTNRIPAVLAIATSATTIASLRSPLR